MKVSYALLHSPFFFQGINFGDKLDPSKRSDLSLEYDKGEKELLVTFKGCVTHLPCSNIVHYTPAKEAPEAPAEAVKAPAPAVKTAPKGPFKAQVTTPTDHVFTPGAGRKRD